MSRVDENKITVQVGLPARTAALTGKSTIEIQGSDSDKSVIAMIRETGQYDPHVMDAITEHLPAGGVFVDIGANLGVLSVVAALRVGAEGKVLSVEASPLTFDLLRDNLVLNGCQQAVPVNVGVWDEATVMTFTHVVEGPGWSYFSTQPYDHSDVDIPVRCQTLDTVVEEAGLERIDLLKIDVEGSETRVLRGAAKTLQRFKPTIILEINPGTLYQHFGASFSELVQCIHDYGYSMQAISWDSQFMPVADADDLKRLLDHVQPWFDMLCEYDPDAQLTMPDSRNPGVLHATMTTPTDRLVCRQGAKVSIAVRVRNSGDTVWRRAVRMQPGTVNLGAHLYGADHWLLDWDFFRTPLPRHMAPSAEESLTCEFTAPEHEGQYTLVLDLVDELHCWFSERDSQPVAIHLEVIP